MKSPCSVRTATEADLTAINDVYNHYVLHSTCTYQEEPETIEDRHKWFHHHSEKHPVTVAEINSQIVGWGSLSAYLQTLRLSAHGREFLSISSSSASPSRNWVSTPSRFDRALPATRPPRDHRRYRRRAVRQRCAAREIQFRKSRPSPTSRFQIRPLAGCHLHGTVASQRGNSSEGDFLL